MSVEVKDIKVDEFPFDACCFCRASTTLRYERRIPCCKFCASRAQPEDMPTFKEYQRREKIAYCDSVRHDQA